jgi:hypothetical protein
VNIITNKEWYNKNPSRSKAMATIASHKYKGCKIYVTVEHITRLFEETKICPLCGINLTCRREKYPLPNSSSLDRKDNELELRNDNVWIICHNCNSTKLKRTRKEFYEYCKMIHLKFKKEFGDD